MRLDRHKERELESRKGLATRTIVQVIWLGVSGVIAYFILRWAFDAEYLSYDYFYNTLLIPTDISEEIILGALVLVSVFVMQFFLILGYAFASPLGRERPGDPSAYSTNPDPLENDYRR